MLFAELKVERPNFQISLEEREAAYLAARQRIFAADGGTDEPIKQKPRSNPVVARRMIEHALGQRTKTPNQVISSCTEYAEHTDEMNTEVKKDGAFEEKQTLSRQKYLNGKPKVSTEFNGHALSNTDCKVTTKQAEKVATKIGISGTRKVHKANLEEEQIGAAKRMFAHALGYQSTRENILSKCSETKQNDKGKSE